MCGAFSSCFPTFSMVKHVNKYEIIKAIAMNSNNIHQLRNGNNKAIAMNSNIILSNNNCYRKAV